MDRAIANWITEQINTCADGEEQTHFRDRLLSAAVHTFFYPHRHLPQSTKEKMIKETIEHVGDVIGRAAAKFYNYPKDGP